MKRWDNMIPEPIEWREPRMAHPDDFMPRVIEWKQRKLDKLNLLVTLQECADSEFERRIAVIIASPPWAHVGPYCVDHIVPLKGITPQGYRVSGLNVSWNLQILTSEANSRKRNRMSRRDYEIACSLKRDIKP